MTEKTNLTDKTPNPEMRKLAIRSAIALAGIVLMTGLVAATSHGSTSKICNSEFAKLVENIILAVQAIIPGIAFIVTLIALGGQAVWKDKAPKFKEIRNNAFFYGVIGVGGVGMLVGLVSKLPYLKIGSACWDLSTFIIAYAPF